MCTANRTSSPWHNFLSDTEHWVVDGTGATPCVNPTGMYGLGVLSLTTNAYPFLASLVENGAESIFTTTAEATFLGTPTPSYCKNKRRLLIRVKKLIQKEIINEQDGFFMKPRNNLVALEGLEGLFNFQVHETEEL